MFDRLRSLERVVVAYSGGVDSAFLAWAAHRAVGAGALALTADSASLGRRELGEARALARTIGIEHRVVATHELERAEYVENAPSRCYFCKDTLFDVAALVARTEGRGVVVDGFNADDVKDFRPGHRAAAEHGVLHPLAEVGLSKLDIRELSRQAGLPTWRKPQLACLASRIPYGVPVTSERLARVEGMEDAMRDLGFHDLRARLVPGNDDMLRLEVGEGELGRALELRAELLRAAQGLGFRFTTLDLEGFRSGRMNEGLVQLSGALRPPAD